MDQRRQFLSLVVAVACFFVWMQVAPLLFPQFFPQPKPPGARPPVKPVAKQQADEHKPEAAGAKPVEQAAPEVPKTELAKFPERTIVLGEGGFEKGFLMKAQLSTRGAIVEALWLTDPRYTTDDRQGQLKLVGNKVNRNVGTGPVPETFALGVPAIDKALAAHDESLWTVNWEVVSQDARSVTFRYPSPAGDLEVLKTYRIPEAALATRDSEAEGYLLDLDVEIRNLSQKPITDESQLVGPVGVPLENADNTRVFREIKLGTHENPRNPSKVTATTMTAAELVKQYDKSRQQHQPLKDWRAPVQFAGVDNQFFAALLLPQGDQQPGPDETGKETPRIAIVSPVLLSRDSAHAERSDMTIVLQSNPITIPAQGTATQEFKVFFGPKRPQLLAELNAESIIQLGWFASVAKIMLLVLGFFHGLGMPYALAIITLTVFVRMAMFPVSRKQAIESEKMKILAPKMKEMQEKYKNQPEEFAKAYREFQRKHKYHPMVGCLPALIQLPIFLGLYNSLYHAVDLRLAKFLWIDNLAAPDRLFALGFTVPWFGWTDFNLLPVITVILFVVQQKMFTPPPTSDEQAMQFKMMNFMMIAVGFAFYRVPAGLCLYFIASSLWGVCERLLLKKSLALHQQAIAEAGNETATVTVTGAAKEAQPESRAIKAPGWWNRIVEAADQAKNATEGQGSARKFSKDKGSKPRR
jgi:YidC/Oxa1 family membrane protein insertase